MEVREREAEEEWRKQWSMLFRVRHSARRCLPVQTGSQALADTTGRAGPQAAGKPAVESVCAREHLQEREHLWAALHLNASDTERLETICWSYFFVSTLLFCFNSGFWILQGAFTF